MISIREATEGDAAELSQLAERTFRDTFASANSAEDMEAHCRTTYSASIQLSEINDSSRTTLLCHAGDRLIAYGQLRWNAAPACVVASKPAEIQRLYVDVPWHGKGVSQALMASLLSKALAEGADVAWLGVWERNPRAASFYEKSGFAIVGEHVFTLGNDPQRDLILAKELI